MFEQQSGNCPFVRNSWKSQLDFSELRAECHHVICMVVKHKCCTSRPHIMLHVFKKTLFILGGKYVIPVLGSLEVKFILTNLKSLFFYNPGTTAINGHRCVNKSVKGYTLILLTWMIKKFHYIIENTVLAHSPTMHASFRALLH